MNYMTTIQLLLTSTVVSALVSSAMNYFMNESSKNKDRKADYLDRQIQCLYWPLHAFFSLNMRFLKLSLEYRKSQNKTWDYNEKTTDEIINIWNDYVSCIEENNEKIKERIYQYSDLIDTDDMPIFIDFLEHQARSTVERDENKKFRAPPEIAKDVWEIYFIKPEIVERLEKKCNCKKKYLKELKNLV